MKKSITAILMTTVILLSFLGTALLIQNVKATDPTSWYTIKNGVLSSDYYSLYPYVNDSLDMGLSKYGEMISDNGAVSVGLQYPGYEVVGTYDQTLGTSRDPFANEGVEKKLWLNGWLMEIRYTHRTLRDREILAMAMFADMAAFGGDWLNGFNASKINGLAAAPHGGRKCTGYATTDPLTILYDGPRSYIALSVTHIFDWTDDNGNGVVDHPSETWPVLDLRITFIFEKDKKEVIILKDIKLLMSGKELGSPVDVQFSDREEWDLGPTPEWPSYAHFYHQQLTTCYGPDWHLAPGIMREYQYKGPGDIAGVAVKDSRDPYGPPIAAGSVRVYVKGVFMEEGLDYDINYNTGVITWHIAAPTHTDELKVIYKLYKYTDMTLKQIMTGVPHLYDVAQIISADQDANGNLAPQYVGWKAFWPVLSDYTVDGWTNSLEPLLNVSQPDMIKEPEIPFTIGEWDFLLGKNYPVQFRGVEVVGLTDFHDAGDTKMWQGANNVIDREAKYQLDEVFNPWDLVDAVHKQSARWVEFVNITSVGQVFTTNLENVPVIVRPSPTSNYVQIGPHEYIPDPTEWDQYSVDSERIIDLNTSTLLMRGVDYTITQNSDGTASVTFAIKGNMKILYSSMGMYVTTQDNANNAGTYGVSDGDMGVYLGGTDPLAPIEFYIVTPDPTSSWKVATLKIHDYDVDLGYGETDAVYLNGYLLGMLQGDSMTWVTTELPFPGWMLNKNGMQYVQIFISCDNSQPLPVTITPTNKATWPKMTGVWDVTVDSGSIVFAYDEHTPMPRYEWGVVGRDAVSVDSAGLSMVSAAFKDKQIEYGLAGEDMQDAAVANQFPSVMSKFGSGTTTNDYNDAKGRSALKDDWCHTWPVASSNLIAVGGPLINKLTYYLNDYVQAIYGIPSYTPYGPWNGAVVATTCWAKNRYFSNSTTGYATISTYLDINGTVIFSIWGVWGRDTYYATKIFQSEIIYELQKFPPCATSIVIKIDYKDPMHPTFTIPEVLGTISEHAKIIGTPLGDKGGIHDP